MAITKIKAIRTNLKRCLNYTRNEEKTHMDKLPAQLRSALYYTMDNRKTAPAYVTGFNCLPETAFDTMMATKRRWGKPIEGHVLGYHIIQSFSPGEVTPEQAHEIGCELVRRTFAHRYEATVCTHLDKEHLHSHIVINSVSYRDGTMYRNKRKDYYESIRRVSDALCREYGLTVTEPARRARQYSEWQAEQQRQPTMRGMIRADIDRIAEKAISWDTFLLGLRKNGYEVKTGPNRKYTAVRHRAGQRFIRLDSLGDGYTEQALRQRFRERIAARPDSPPEQNRRADYCGSRGASGRVYPYRRPTAAKRYGGRFPFPRCSVVRGFLARYYHFLHLLGSARQGHSSRRCRYLLREDFQKFDRYLNQYRFLCENRIEDIAQLRAVRNRAEEEADALKKQRKKLYRKQEDPTNGLNKRQLAEDIAALTARLKELRGQVRLCNSIEADAAYLQQQLSRVLEAQRQERLQEETKSREQTAPGRNR